MQVLTVLRKDLVSKIIIENWINLASHPYYIVLDFKEAYREPSKILRRTRIVNFYDNKLEKRYPWQGTNMQV